MTSLEARAFITKYRRLAMLWVNIELTEQDMRVKLPEIYDDDDLIIIFMEAVERRMIRRPV